MALQTPEPVSEAHAAKFNPCISYRHDSFSRRKIYCYFKSTLVLFPLLCFLPHEALAEVKCLIQEIDCFTVSNLVLNVNSRIGLFLEFCFNGHSSV